MAFFQESCFVKSLVPLHTARLITSRSRDGSRGRRHTYTVYLSKTHLNELISWIVVNSGMWVRSMRSLGLVRPTESPPKLCIARKGRTKIQPGSYMLSHALFLNIFVFDHLLQQIPFYGIFMVVQDRNKPILNQPQFSALRSTALLHWIPSKSCWCGRVSGYLRARGTRSERTAKD